MSLVSLEDQIHAGVQYPLGSSLADMPENVQEHSVRNRMAAKTGTPAANAAVKAAEAIAEAYDASRDEGANRDARDSIIRAYFAERPDPREVKTSRSSSSS